MSTSKTNTAHELPGHFTLPTFSWADRHLFAALTRGLGGSSDTGGADLCLTDRPGHHGRYPRNYTESPHEGAAIGLPADVEGQTMSFFASTRQRSPSAPRGVVALIGAPWATQAERDATYAWLARAAGAVCNDATPEEEAWVVSGPIVDSIPDPHGAPADRLPMGRKYLVITRHPALVQYLREQGHIGDEARVIDQATDDDVRGQHVIGILPIRLAALCASYSECSLVLAPQDRGVTDLTIERVREIAQPIATYRVEVRS